MGAQPGALAGQDAHVFNSTIRANLVLTRPAATDDEASVFVVLDEPTVHLDPETADALLRDPMAAADDRTVLLITHRPEGLDLVDEIVELEPV